MRRALRLVVGMVALGACGSRTDTTHASAEDHGRALFSDRAASPSQSNAFSCATCHPRDGASAAGRVFPGASLAGVTARTSFWGGRENDLLRSINDCRVSFMDAPSPWIADDEDARAMYAYLLTLAGPPDAVPFTLVEPPVPDVPAGDLARAPDVFAGACQPCHGALHDGKGRLTSFVPALPDEVLAQHASLSPEAVRSVFVQKIRRGAADVPGQSMPPFSRETLSDADLAAVVALLGR